jgi:IMP dehydrogenase
MNVGDLFHLKNLIVARAHDMVSSAMAMMIKTDIRHLPVIEENHITRILTISDPIKFHVGELTTKLHYWQDYITDLQHLVAD